MNYRLRDAVLGLLVAGPVRSQGLRRQRPAIEPSEFAARLQSIREDYPDAAYYSAMNLLDSHDTERLLWTLTPGADDRGRKEENAANVAEGKQRLRLASLIQFTVPGAPTVYYGDEVGVTGDDDPDDRRTYPWADLGGSPDTRCSATTRRSPRCAARIRRCTSGSTSGRLLADDAAGTVAYGRRRRLAAAVVALNRGAARRSPIPVAATCRRPAR